jgi:hypothetical protein
MAELYNRAFETGPAHAAIDRLVYCHILNRITNGDLETALDVYAEPGTVQAAEQELEDLNDEERAELVVAVVPMWNMALSLAVKYLWHACRKLGYDPAGLGPDHVALVGSVFLGAHFTHLAELDAPGDEPVDDAA